MGSYEDEYRKYYTEVKAKLNVKSDKKDYRDGNVLKNEEVLCLESTKDIYPKTDYNYNAIELNEDGEKKSNDLSERIEFRGTYGGIENYTGGNGAIDIPYGGRNYYGNNMGSNLNNKVEEKNILMKWGNRIIIELSLTVVLFVGVIVLKAMPYKEAQSIYATCKEVINTDFDYKVFIEDIKTINIMDEIDKLKVNLKIDDDVKVKSDDVIENETEVGS